MSILRKLHYRCDAADAKLSDESNDEDYNGNGGSRSDGHVLDCKSGGRGSSPGRGWAWVFFSFSESTLGQSLQCLYHLQVRSIHRDRCAC